MTHIKKAISLICLFAVIISALTSCGGDGCAHEFGEWQVVKEATCGAGGYSIRVCSLCGAEDRNVKYALPHSFSEEWIYDGTHHWHKALCEHESEVSDRGAHTFSGNTCSVCDALRATQGLAYRGILGQGEYLVSGIGTTLDENVVVARYYNGHDIVGIDDGAFRGTEGLLSVYMQKYIKTVGDGAFADCPDLGELTLTVGLEYIGAEILSGSEKLTSIRFLGSAAEWGKIEKSPLWASGSSLVEVRCNDSAVAVAQP